MNLLQGLLKSVIELCLILQRKPLGSWAAQLLFINGFPCKGYPLRSCSILGCIHKKTPTAKRGVAKYDWTLEGPIELIFDVPMDVFLRLSLVYNLRLGSVLLDRFDAVLAAGF